MTIHIGGLTLKARPILRAPRRHIDEISIFIVFSFLNQNSEHPNKRTLKLQPILKNLGATFPQKTYVVVREGLKMRRARDMQMQLGRSKL